MAAQIQMSCGGLFMRKPAIIVATLFAAWLYLFVPGKVVVSTSGDIAGLHGVQELIQGERFWKGQNEAARKELTRLLDEPRRNAKFKADMSKLAADIARDDSANCAKDTGLCMPPPTPSEKLRARADELETQELDRWLEEARLQRMAELRTISALTAQRVR